ncbi:uncharacterized protein LOC120070018 isoform X2 [Benincasa hispida]|uniref:uncharacterized protein LOC120070018 isoform X2 n=1 Tax=Benincasa hispida TaxID=102211 RepID=UPI001901A641|nr:uncharacterized protein LOC120070018 isoform X2 [Benincasa hispida]
MEKQYNGWHVLMPYQLPQKKLRELEKATDSATECGARKVKIVVTKEQFKLLLANAKKLQSRHRLLSYTGPRKGCRKWRPTLSAISEEEDF